MVEASEGLSGTERSTGCRTSDAQQGAGRRAEEPVAAAVYDDDVDSLGDDDDDDLDDVEDMGEPTDSEEELSGRLAAVTSLPPRAGMSELDSVPHGMGSAGVAAGLALGGGPLTAPVRAQSPRTARRLRNREAAARMRARQKERMQQLELRRADLERQVTTLEQELNMVRRQNNPSSPSIRVLAKMIDDMTQVEGTMLDAIGQCQELVRILEALYQQRMEQQRQPQPQPQQQP
ncbi:hypothetical protein GGF46_003797 [Coemansia sp. RSA 552]|nr:hypothetical protein GGF46_003797 [Coemansia sp. RSA 552]